MGLAGILLEEGREEEQAYGKNLAAVGCRVGGVVCS